jgi:PAS domain S-box-containing protein
MTWMPNDEELRQVRRLVGDLDAVVWEAEPSTLAITFVSEGIARLLGLRPAAWTGRPRAMLDAVHPEDAGMVASTLGEATAVGSRFDVEARFVHRDGAPVWCRIVGHAVADAEGRATAIRGLLLDVTRRHLREQDRREAEERFRGIVERLPVIVYLEGAGEGPGRTGMLYVSPQVEPLLGITPREWIEDPMAWARLFHADDRDRVREAFEMAETSGEPVSVEYRMTARDGTTRWFRDDAVLVRDDRGRPAFWQGVMIDLTDERTAQRSLGAEEVRARTLVDQIPAIVYTEEIDSDAVAHLSINGRIEQLLGISRDEWSANPRTWLEAIHPDDRDAVERENARVERTGEPFSMEYRMIARDGRVRWFRDEAVRIHDERGVPTHWQGVMIDITDRKAAEASLAEAEARYRALVEQNPSITYIDAVEGDVGTLYISPQTTEILGYTPEEWYEDDGLFTKLILPEDAERLARHRGDDPAPTSSTYRVRAKDGRIVWLHDQATLITDDDGSPRYWIGVLVDLTEQRRTEELARSLEDERRRTEELEEADELKTTYLQAISHDLRTPLAAILGLAVTLERDDVALDRDEVHDLGRRIAQNARRLDAIVRNLLDLERLGRGDATPAFTPTDVGGLVRELAASAEVVGGRRLDIDTAPLSIPADPTMVERIVENLLANVAKHTPGDTRVWIRIERHAEGALLTVEDDGPGVPPHEREAIFEAFRQGDGEAAGTGLGLALVARFASLHGGRAWAEERAGGGASFRVLLPFDPQAALARARERASAQPTGAGSSEASQA